METVRMSKRFALGEMQNYSFIKKSLLRGMSYISQETTELAGSVIDDPHESEGDTNVSLLTTSAVQV